MPPDPQARTAPLYLLMSAFAVVYVVWGSTYLGIRWVVESMPPFLSAGTRFALAGLLLFAFLQLKTPTRITRAQWANAALIGTLLLLGGNGLVCWASQMLPSGLTALIVGTAPMWFAALDWLFFRGPRPRRLTLLGFLVGSVGIYALVGPARLSTGPQVTLAPVLALLAACASWALGSLYSRRAAVPKSAFLATATQMLCGGLTQIVAGLLLGEAARLDLAAVTVRSWLSWGYLVVFGSLLAFSCYVWLLRHASPARVSTYAYVNPVIAVFLGALLGGELITLRVLVAAGLIVLAVVLITMPGRPRPAAQAPPPTPAAAPPAVAAGASTSPD